MCEYAEHRLVHVCRFSNAHALYPTRMCMLVVKLAVCVHATVQLYSKFQHCRITLLWPQANSEAENFMKPVTKTIRSVQEEGKI